MPVYVYRRRDGSTFERRLFELLDLDTRICRSTALPHEHGPAARRDDAGLMVSELVANALRHGAGVITASVCLCTT